MLFTSRWPTALGLILVLGCATFGASNAETRPAERQLTLGYAAVNGWDLRVSETPAETSDQTVIQCALSTTMLAEPSAGASGGRTTIKFDVSQKKVIAEATVTGNGSIGRPLEVLVDGHVIVDKVPRAATIRFSPEASRNLFVLFKAGRSGLIRFNRNGEFLSVPISLSGFSRASALLRKRCS